MFFSRSRRLRNSRGVNGKRVLHLETLENRRVMATLYPDASIADGETGSLRDIIQQANLNDEDDVIMLSADTYSISLAGTDDDDNLLGDFDLFDAGSSISFVGANIGETIIDGNGLDRVFDITSAVTVSMEALTITGGSTTGSDDGGAIQSLGALNLNNVEIVGNTARDGGGLLVDASSVITNSSIHGNTASRSGGGIKGYGSLTITDSDMSNNDAGSGNGGGYDNDAAINVFISDSTFSGNSAGGSGGGMNNSGGRIHELHRVTFSDNSAGIMGGGIQNDGGRLISVRNVTISGNNAGTGGGVANFGGIISQLIQTTIVSNEAVTEGGGVDNTGGDIDIRNSLIANNTSPIGPDYSGKFTSQGYNLIENTSDILFRGNQTGDIVGVVPDIEPLADNGGTTMTHALNAASPAIGNGTLSVAATVDQRGFSRDAQPDIGAFEFQAPGADIVDVSPDPRNAHAGTVTVEFSRAVTGVDITDFELTLDGQSVGLDGLNVSGADGSYSIDLSSVTDDEGEYVLTLVASGSGILGGIHEFTEDASESWRYNTAPVAASDGLSMIGNDSLSVTAAELLQNDSDANGDSLTVLSVGNGSHGSVSDNQDGTYSYTPTLDFHGTDSFSYSISDGNGATGTAMVTVDVAQSWQNSTDPLDVDGNEAVEPHDVLLLINYINEVGNPAPLPNSPTSSPFFDVNNNGVVDPHDVLRVVNFINQQAGFAGESLAPTTVRVDSDNLDSTGELELDAELVDRALLLFEW
jgi:hypothetical protein